MYVIKIKRLVERSDKRKVWEGVPAEILVNVTLLDYIMSESTPVVAALFNNEELTAVITNDPAYVEQYSKKCLAILADQLSELMLPDGSTIELVAKVFPDGKVCEVKAA